MAALFYRAMRVGHYLARQVERRFRQWLREAIAVVPRPTGGLSRVGLYRAPAAAV
jgi:hypothetical protein